MTGSRISPPTAGGFGAVVRFDGDATTLLQMVTINDVEGGGAIYLDIATNTNIYLEDVVFSKCGAINGVDGGAIHHLGGTLTATRVTISDCWSTNGGGAAYHSVGTTVTYTDSSFLRNKQLNPM